LPELEHSYDLAGIEAVMLQVAESMQNNYPYFHPYYAGQMLKPPHPVARLAYMLSLWINPNNHALDGGLASSHFEKEAVSEIARLFGWETFLGHLTGGGTMANMEALWISGQLNPGKKVVASEQAHYTHKRISDVLGLGFQSIPCDDQARMDPTRCESPGWRQRWHSRCHDRRDGTGSVDPLLEILKLKAVRFSPARRCSLRRLLRPGG
jgi:glutamate/tyrosine decarboxylase-like PLP-dependent enzyme